MDFIFATPGTVNRCNVMYNIDAASDHNLLISKTKLNVLRPGTPDTPSGRADRGGTANPRRPRSTKGWRPLDAEASSKYLQRMSLIPENASVSDIHGIFCECIPEIPYSNSFQRKARHRDKEPEDLAQARLNLAQQTDPAEQHRAARLLYRQKRRWLRQIATDRFARTAMSAPRDDLSATRRVQWMFDKNGKPSHDSRDWSESVRDHFQTLFTSKVETPETQLARLKTMEDECLSHHASSSHEWIPLSMHALLDARNRMGANKAPGGDLLVHEMFTHLPWQALDAIRSAFENRLNGAPGHINSFPAWRELLVKCIPKTRAARRPAHWRSLSLVSTFQKWYMSCVAEAIRARLPPFKCDMHGFLPGKQTGEITEALRLLLQKADEWGIPLAIVKGDVEKAFDNIEHGLLDRALLAKGIPLALRTAVLRELTDVTLDIRLQDVRVPEIHLGKGGKQGCSSTPLLWNIVLDYVLGQTVDGWRKQGLGLDLGDDDGPITDQIWADDTFCVSGSVEEAACMAQDLCYALGDGHLALKPGSLSVLANKTALRSAPAGCREGFSILDRRGVPLLVPRVAEMTILGVQIDESASSACAIEHRIAAAQAHFFARRAQLTCSRVPLRDRLRRLYATVGASFLWGSGGWTLSRALVRRIESFELSLLRRTIHTPRRVSESWVDYLKRSATTARTFLTQFGIDSLAVRAIKANHGWAGHAARAPAETTLARALRFRNLDWWTRTQTLGQWDRGNTSGWRHPRTGPHTRWETPLYSLIPNWATLAQDRESWRSSLSLYVNRCSARFAVRNRNPPTSKAPTTRRPPLRGPPPYGGRPRCHYSGALRQAPLPHRSQSGTVEACPDTLAASLLCRLRWHRVPRPGPGPRQDPLCRLRDAAFSRCSLPPGSQGHLLPPCPMEEVLSRRLSSRPHPRPRPCVPRCPA